jgi:hypothetical protein
MVNMKKKKFSKNIDLNGDNKIDVDEYKKWYMPSLEQVVGEERAALLKACDEDKNEQLNEAEVLKCCPTLLNSQITNFGIDLNPPTQIAQQDFRFNDEL